jgi:hypothetical protein
MFHGRLRRITIITITLVWRRPNVQHVNNVKQVMCIEKQ